MRALAASLLLAVALAVPATAAAPVKLRHGKTTLAFDRSFGLALLQSGVDAGPDAPATQDGIRFSLPITGGRVDATGSRTTVKMAGGLDLVNVAEGTSINQTHVRLVFRGRHAVLSAFAAIKGQGYDRFAFATGTAEKAARTASGFTATGIALRLNQIGATALNSQFRTDVFTEGELIATGRVRARR